ncbi:MAG TPA: hypothetical protein PLT54_06745 [Rhodoferax sp.]|jgi:hypothetical protein|nr:hypothetical protein [Rhodoferax sp.]
MHPVFPGVRRNHSCGRGVDQGAFHGNGDVHCVQGGLACLRAKASFGFFVGERSDSLLQPGSHALERVDHGLGFLNLAGQGGPFV